MPRCEVCGRLPKTVEVVDGLNMCPVCAGSTKSFKKVMENANVGIPGWVDF